MLMTLMLMFVMLAYAKQWISFNGSPESTEPEIIVLDSNEQVTTVKIKLNGFFKEEVIHDNIKYDNLLLPGWANIASKGSPSLPGLSAVIGIPNTADVNVSYTVVDSVLFSDMLIYPSQDIKIESAEDTVFFLNNKRYSTDEIWPLSTIHSSSPYIMRDIRVVNTSIKPFKFNPVQKKVKIYNEIIITYNFSGLSNDNIIDFPPRYIRPELEESYKKYIVNYDFLDIPDIDIAETQFDMLIVTTNSHIEFAEKYANMRNLSGTKSKVFVLPENLGDNWENYRDAIYDEYPVNVPNNHLYLLLIGDADLIPFNTMYNNVRTDRVYSKSNGNFTFDELISYDELAQTNILLFGYDLIVGRLPFEDDEAQYTLDNYLTKIASHYMHNQYQTKTNNVLTVAGYNNIDPFSEENPLVYIQNTTEAWQNINNWDYPQNLEQINYTDYSFEALKSTISGGDFGTIFYRGHGSSTNGWLVDPPISYFTYENMRNTETDTSPFVFDICCSTGNFEATSSSWEWTKKQPGTVGFVGHSIASYTLINNRFYIGITDELWNQSNENYLNHIGLQIYEAQRYSHQVTGSSEEYLGPAFQVHNYFSNNIMSDPSYVIDYPSNDANLNYVLDEMNKTISLFPTSNDDNTVIYFLDTQFEPIEEIRTNDNGIYSFTTPIYNQDLYKLNIGYIYIKSDIFNDRLIRVLLNNDFSQFYLVSNDIYCCHNSQHQLRDINRVPKNSKVHIAKNAFLVCTSQDFLELDSNSEFIIDCDIEFIEHLSNGKFKSKDLDNLGKVIFRGTSIDMRNFEFEDVNVEFDNCETVTIENTTFSGTGIVSVNMVDELNITATTFNQSVTLNLCNSVNIDEVEFYDSVNYNDLGHVNIIDSNFNQSASFNLCNSLFIGQSEFTGGDNSFTALGSFNIQDTDFITNDSIQGFGAYFSNCNFNRNLFKNCRFSNNSYWGLYVANSNATLEACKIIENDLWGINTSGLSFLKIKAGTNPDIYDESSLIKYNGYEQVLQMGNIIDMYEGKNKIISVNFPLTSSTIRIATYNTFRNIDVRGNYWGLTQQGIPLTPNDTHLYHQEYDDNQNILGYNVVPVWDGNTTPVMYSTDDRIAYDNALDLASSGAIDESIENLKYLISEFPDSPYLKPASVHLYALEQDKEALKDYYNNTPNLQFNDIASTIEYLSAHCDIKLGSYDEAINWLQDQLNSNVLPSDSLMYVMDLAYIQLLQEKDLPKNNDNNIEINLAMKKMYQKYNDVVKECINALKKQEYDYDDNYSTFVESSPRTVLSANYPNPFNPETQIDFMINAKDIVKLEIFNLKGQKIKTLLNETLNQGKHTVLWNGTNNRDKQVASGIYFYKLTTSNKSLTKKMILIK